MGDPTNVIARSNWEFRVFSFLDGHNKIRGWSSETTIIGYKCKTDNRLHRYFVDLKIVLDSGRTILVEIKPAYQVAPPVKSAEKREHVFIRECLRYAKNTSKWEAAKRYCETRGWEFRIWDEHVLEKFGIKGIVPVKKSKYRRVPNTVKKPKSTPK
jgi:hypothetical protein